MSASDQSRLADELASAGSQLVRRLRMASPEGALTPSQRSVIGRLGTEGPATTAALARAELVRPQSMRATLCALEEQGLVGRAPHPTDGRQVIFSLTEAGRERLGQLRHAKRTWLADAIGSQLTAEEQRVLAEAVGLIKRLTTS
ncbi:MarR family transcriptional regulator [Streptomyces sp. RB6PN25]|uniref:MarR family transcriptional regulator n=1 Tax=Streptomyces humicola TaxID=2953240 RepID=A0ABT1Q3Z0_9ACTN|nr:MarR family transcriptional regulator [Streptomyces humicola]MCQ4084646.1 MarR family transcriptional regulator [Streptomyces humicola]